MPDPKFAEVQVGDEIPLLSTSPITRHTLALYCGASGDHNPIHVDIDYAKESGLDDVIAHGMLSMAYLGRLLTNLSLIHISEPTDRQKSRMPSSA